MWDLRSFEDNIVIMDEFNNHITYGELDSLGSELSSRIKKRCLTFILCTNTTGSLLGYISFISHGIVPVLVNAHLETGLLENLLKTYMPAFVWLPSGQKEYFSSMTELYHAYGYSLLQTDYDIEYPLHEDLCLLLTTSGSTGSPKFVRQSYENVLSNAKSIAKYLELSSDERAITTLPMNYTYGLSIVNSHLLVGATLLVTEKGLMQKEFWSFFRNSQATSFGGVPYTYEMLDKLKFYRMALPSLRYMTQAGGKLDPELHRRFAEYAAANEKKFIVMYGQCEATARMGYLPAEKTLEKCGSMGIAIPGGRFRLIDGDGKEISEAYVTGELVYEGPNVTMGYAEKPEDLALGDVRNGYLETGDMAKRDEEGYYYIVGRKKRFLKVYGNRVNLDELDGLLKAGFGNIECSCGGIDDHVYIFVAEGTKNDLQKKYRDDNVEVLLKKYVAEKTGLNAAAFQTVVIKEIPKNDAGKVQYRELEKYYGL